MKKLMGLSVGLFLVVSMILAGCAGGGDDEDRTTLKFWNRYPEVKEFLPDIIDDFEEENPDIKVDMEYTPASTYPEQYDTALSNDELPDVFTTGGASLTDLIDLDKAQKLNDLFTDEEMDEYIDGTWTAGSFVIDDDVYVLPLYSPNHAAQVMFYNKDVLDEYGISEDEVPETWDELMDIGQTIYEKSDGSVYGLIESKEDWVIGGVVRAMSKAITPEVPEAMNFKEGHPQYYTDGNIETIEYLKDLLDNDVLAPESLEVSKDEGRALFSAGQAAFFIQGQFQGPVLLEQDGFENWGVAEVPTKDGEPTYWDSRGGDGFMANKNSDHPEEVETFMEYLKDHIYEDAVVKSGSDSPKKDVDMSNAPYEQYEELMKLIEEKGKPVPIPAQRDIDVLDFDHDFMSELSEDEIGGPAIGYMTGGDKDLEKVVKKMDDDANEVFENMFDEYPDISEDIYKFPNWDPLTPYTDEDYDDLDD